MNTMKSNITRKLFRFAPMLLSATLFASPLLAADPFVGQWKLNLAKCDYKQGSPPREQIVTITEAAGDLTVRVDGVQSDGTKTVVYYAVPVEGGKGKMFESAPAYDSISGKHIGPGEREIIRWKDGKEVFNAHAKVSADNKALTAYTVGVSPLGKPVEAHIYYDRLK